MEVKEGQDASSFCGGMTDLSFCSAVLLETGNGPVPLQVLYLVKSGLSLVDIEAQLYYYSFSVSLRFCSKMPSSRTYFLKLITNFVYEYLNVKHRIYSFYR